MDHRVAVRKCLRGRPVASHHVDGPGRVDGRAGRAPDSGPSNDRGPEGNMRSAVNWHSPQISVVIAAVAKAPTKWDVDATRPQGKRAALLLNQRVRAGRVDIVLAHHRPVGQAQGEENMVVSAQERDHIQTPAHHIRGRRARDAGHRSDVSAGERGCVNGIAQVPMPNHRAAEEIQRVNGVVLGRDHDVPCNDQGRSVNIAVNLSPPRLMGDSKRRRACAHPRASRVLAVLRPIEPKARRRRRPGGDRDRRRAGSGAAGSTTTRDANREHETNTNRKPGLPPTPWGDHSPQLNLLTPVRRARAGPMSSARPRTATPRLGPMASTTMAARGSAVRLRSLTPSTSNSKAPESLNAYMTGTACGHPDGPTVARRPMRCERRNSSSGSVKTITSNRIVAAAAVPLVDCKDSVWTRAIIRRQKTRRRHWRVWNGQYRRTRFGGGPRLHDRSPRATPEARGLIHRACSRAHP